MLLLDSDIVIDVLRKHPPAIAWLESVEQEELALSGFVLMELIQGCRNRGEQQRLERVVGEYALVWPTPAACNAARVVFSQYYLSHNLGMLDAIIGQTAVTLGLPLYTFNQKHYAVIPGLETRQPYSR
jgi:predicted nucleic acid-binding protein